MKLTLLRGVPGAGKSTYARKHYSGCLLLENDMFHMHNGLYDYKKENQLKAVSWCHDACEFALKNGMDVVVANTFTQKRYIEAYQKLALKYGAEFEVICLDGHFENIHKVPEKVLESMSTHFELWSGEKIISHDELLEEPNENEDIDPAEEDY